MSLQPEQIRSPEDMYRHLARLSMPDGAGRSSRVDALIDDYEAAMAAWLADPDGNRGRMKRAIRAMRRAHDADDAAGITPTRTPSRILGGWTRHDTDPGGAL